jgi:hypothetical protein
MPSTNRARDAVRSNHSSYAWIRFHGTLGQSHAPSPFPMAVAWPLNPLRSGRTRNLRYECDSNQIDCFAAVSRESFNAVQLGAYLIASSYFSIAFLTWPCSMSTSPHALSGSAQCGPF